MFWNGGEVHSVRNQSEYPRISRFAKFVQRWRGYAAELNWPGGISIIPYHKDNFNYGGIWRPAYAYPMTHPIEEDMYPGEAFLVMQDRFHLPHPSQLPDNTPLGGEELAEVMNGR